MGEELAFGGGNKTFGGERLLVGNEQTFGQWGDSPFLSPSEEKPETGGVKRKLYKID